MDLETNTGIYWVQTAATLPYWVLASPLRTLFHWWVEKQGYQLLHAAAIGDEEYAVLITGKGGVGKSTSALSSLRYGLHFLADDYVITRLGPDPIVYSLYSTAKLNADHVTNFPELLSFVNNPDHLDEEKAVMFLYPHLKKQIVSEMPLKAILSPRLNNLSGTSLVPVQSWTMQRALSFTTMSQLPYVGRHTHEYITKLSASLPCYTLELGRDLYKISEALLTFLHATSAHSPYPGLSASEPLTAKTKPLVSVIMPVYNGGHFIEDAIKNILSQDYPALEIIVVDDGSIDRTGEIVQQLTTDVRYFRQENNGPASARNRGIRDASGELIVFLDVDDLWPDNNLNKLVDEMLCNHDISIIRGYAQITEYNEITGEPEFVR